MNLPSANDSASVDHQYLVYALFEMRNKVDTIHHLLTKDLSEEERERMTLIEGLGFREDILSASKKLPNQPDLPEFLVRLRAEADDMRAKLSALDSDKEE